MPGILHFWKYPIASKSAGWAAKGNTFVFIEAYFRILYGNSLLSFRTNLCVGNSEYWIRAALSVLWLSSFQLQLSSCSFNYSFIRFIFLLVHWSVYCTLVPSFHSSGVHSKIALAVWWNRLLCCVHSHAGHFLMLLLRQHTVPVSAVTSDIIHCDLILNK
jgi:hypothetical protein